MKNWNQRQIYISVLTDNDYKTYNVEEIWTILRDKIIELAEMITG